MSDNHDGPERNDGVIISGGTVQDATVVAGRNNRVTVHHLHAGAGADAALLQARADAARLVDLLAAGGHDLPDEQRARSAALVVKEELDEEQPDPSLLRKWLTKLGELVGRVAPLAELVVAVEESVRVFAGG